MRSAKGELVVVTESRTEGVDAAEVFITSVAIQRQTGGDLAEILDRIGYKGWIGCEYKPATSTVAGLGWRQRIAR